MQQLRLPDFLALPHLGHIESTVVGVGMASGGVVVPERTDFGYALAIQKLNKTPGRIHSKH